MSDDTDKWLSELGERIAARREIGFDETADLYDEVTRLRILVETTLWQPIATAPRDGTEVFFHRSPPYSATGNIVIGFWHDGQNTPGWVAQGNCGVILPQHWPYWRPLMAPPSFTSDKSK